MRLSDQQFQFTRNVIGLLTYCDSMTDNGMLDKFVIGEVWRQPEMQKILFDKGYSKVKHSNHQDKLAIDLYFWVNGKFIKNEKKNRAYLMTIGIYWEKLHPLNQWGGNYTSFTDLPHFEMCRIK